MVAMIALEPHWLMRRPGRGTDVRNGAHWQTGPRGAEERAAGLSAIEAHDPSITTGGSQWPKTGAEQGSRLDPPAAGSCRRPGGTWPLGRRSADRFKQQLHRDLGRASYPLCDVG